jgi:hypothetical protein
VLSCTIAFQQFQPIAGWSRKVAQRLSVMQLAQFALRDALEVRADPTGEASVKSASAFRSAEERIIRGRYIRSAF